MKLEKICTLTKRTAEAEDTKQESRTKPTYFTRTRKMSFTELVYYILHPGKESTRLGLTRFFGDRVKFCVNWSNFATSERNYTKFSAVSFFFAMLGKEGCGMSEQAFSKARSHFSHWPFEKMVRVTTQEEYHSEDARRWNVV